MNPILISDQIIGWWFDQCIDFMLKSYYWPAFIAGNQDNFTELLNPKTYSICRV